MTELKLVCTSSLRPQCCGISSSWLLPSWSCWCLTHHSSLAQAVSHLTPDRILCATCKSLLGLEPLEAHPSQRLVVTALLVPTGTVKEWEQGVTDLK